jgi:autotransporter adhesin
MNTSYRIVWNATTQSWVVASELAKSRKKTSSRTAGSVAKRSAFITVSALALGMAFSGAATAGSPVANGTALQGTYDSVNTDYYQYLYRTSAYSTPQGWDNQYAVGSYVSIGYNASTKVNKTDDAIFRLDGYAGNGRGGGVAVGDSAAVTGETGVAIGAHSQAKRDFSVAMGGNAIASGLGAIATGREALASGNYSVAQGFVSTATGTAAIGIGQSATASGIRSIAIGTSNQISAAGTAATDATYYASAANAAGDDAVSVGTGASSAGDNSLALGLKASTSSTATNGIAMGNTASVSADSGIAIGNGAKASGTSSLSVGTGNNVSGNGSGAFGDPNVIAGNNSYAVGDNNTIPGNGSFAFGNTNTINANNSTVIGSNGAIAAGQTDVFALGNNITSTASNSVVLGSNSTTTRANTVSVGSGVAQRQVVNMAAGTAATDAVNVSQLTPVVSALGGGALLNAATGVVTGPSYTVANANAITGTSGAVSDVGSALSRLDTAVGTPMTVAGNSGASVTRTLGQTLNIVGGATTAGTYSDANIKTVTNSVTGNVDVQIADAPTFSGVVTSAGLTSSGMINANGGLTVAAGKTVNMGGNVVGNVAAGVANTDAVNMGQLNAVSTTANKGWNVQANGGTATQVAPGGTVNVVNGSNTTASFDSATNQLKVDVVNNPTFSGLVTANGLTSSGMINANGGVTVAAGKTVNMGGNVVGNVAAGVATTDAVNMSQLNTTNANVATNATNITRVEGKADQQGTTTAAALGGGTTYNATTGALSGTSFALSNANTIAGTSGAATDVTNGFSKVDSALGTINSSISSITSGTTGLVQQAAAGADLTVGKGTDGVAVDFADKNGNTRTLKNVTAGVADTDAVNMSQLNTTNANVATNATNIATNATNITRVEGKADQQGTATAAALGGGAAYNSVTGAVSAPSYAVQGSTYNNVGSALGRLDTSVTNNTNSISLLTNQINSGTTGLVQQAVAGANLTVGKGTDGVAVDFADKNSNTRTLKNVTAGVADTDAVNMSQLNTTNQNVATNAANIAVNTIHIGNMGSSAAILLGGGTTFDPATGALSGTSFGLNNANAINGTSSAATSVGEGFDKVDNALGAINSSVSSITNQINSGTVGLVQQDAATRNITIAKSTDGTVVDVTGTQGTRKVTGVTAADLSATSTDAVNGSQLYATNQQVSQNTNAITNLSTTISSISAGGTKYFQTNSSGVGASAAGANSVAAGQNAQASASNAVAIGNGAQASQSNSVALGAGSTTSATVATSGTTLAGTSYAYAGANPVGTVSVGSAGNQRTVTNVAAGQVSSTSTDAVNGSQLNATNQAVGQLDSRVSNIESTVNNYSGDVSSISTQVDKLAKGQDGMFQVSQDDNSAKPVVSGTQATAGGNAAVASGKASTALGNNAQATGQSSVAIGANSVASRANTVSVGSLGAERQITNVAAGSADTDAVNVAQMNQTAATSLGAANSYTDTQVGNLAGNVQGALQGLRQSMNDQFQQQGRRIDRGTSMSTAMTTMAGSLGGIDADNRLGAGTGFTNGQAALSVGYQRRLSRTANVTFAASTSGHDTTVGVGVGMGW